jgi:hypothetical protein
MNGYSRIVRAIVLDAQAKAHAADPKPAPVKPPAIVGAFPPVPSYVYDVRPLATTRAERSRLWHEALSGHKAECEAVARRLRDIGPIRGYIVDTSGLDD